MSKVHWMQIVPLALALLGWALTGLRTYADDHGQLQQRVSVVETKEADTERHLERIEHQNDEIRAMVLQLLQRSR